MSEILLKKAFIVLIASTLFVLTFKLNDILDNKISSKNIYLIKFEQLPNKIKLYFDTPNYKISYLILSNTPEELEIDKFRITAISGEIKEGSIEISLNPEIEPHNHEYSILIFVDEKWIELIRQSSTWLKKNYNFNKPNGFTILGRHTLKTKSKQIKTYSQLSFKGKPKIPPLPTTIDSPFPEVNSATSLLKYLWNLSMLSGPSNKLYKPFMNRTFEEKITSLENGDYSLSCTGFRDLFLHAALSSAGFKVRAIEAFNYHPLLPNLIAYSHSTAEIWIESLGKWVLFDPWFGIMLHVKGIPIGTTEIADHKYSKDLEVVALLEGIKRRHKNENGKISENIFDPKSIKALEFTCNNQSCSPGYLEYFSHTYLRTSTLSTN